MPKKLSLFCIALSIAFLSGFLLPTALALSSPENLPPILANSDPVTFWEKTKFFFATGINGENATLLITGGLFIVVFVLGASILNTFVERPHVIASPELASVLTEPLTIRSGKVKSTFDAGLEKSKEMRVRSIDDVFDSLVALGIGDPRMTSSSKKNKTIRIYNCIECQRVSSRKGVCDFTQGFLTGSFRKVQKGGITVHETKCYGSGDDYCEYVIAFGR